MQSSTDLFSAELLTGARLATRIVITIAEKIAEDTFYGGSYLQLVSGSGSVQYDRTGDTRATATFDLILKTLSSDDLIDPVSYPEATIYSGLWNGSEYEWISLGVFGIHTVSYTRGSKTVIASCQATDRSAKIRDNPWSTPYQVAAGLDYYVAIKNIVDGRAKGFTPVYNVSSSALTTPTMNFSDGDDPWSAVMKLAEAVGAEVFFDRQGCLAAFPVADPLTTAPSLTLSSSSSGVTIVPVTKETSNREFYNGVICRGEASWLLFPISGEYWEMNPLSPGYRPTFGDKPLIIGDALATTDAQCLTAATAEYNRIAGVIETISFNTVKDPRLEVGDIIEQRDDYLEILGRYVLDTYTYPLGPGAASGTVRRKR